jgi:hypothetical protein
VDKGIHQQRLALCRGKCTSKDGDSFRQLCTCRAAALEATGRFYFGCAAGRFPTAPRRRRSMKEKALRMAQ